MHIELVQPESINSAEARERLGAAAPDVVCVCAFGGLIREPLLSEYLMLNVHPSLLPRWRGAAPIERAIMAGDSETGVTIMRVTAGLDSGPICDQASEPIARKDTYGSLAERLARAGGELLVRALDAPFQFTEQDEAQATYAEKITSEDRLLDVRRPAIELERRVRALSPHIGALAELDGATLGVVSAQASAHRGDPATPALQCADGYLWLEVVKPPGRREMTGREWLRGHRR